MQIKRIIFSAALILWAIGNTHAQTVVKADVCIYGGTSAGVIAAYTVGKLHKSVILIEPGKRLGGLTSGGLGYTDIGNKYAINGISKDFYRRIGKHYGKFEQWIFEPHVAEQTFLRYIQEAKVKVVYGYELSAMDNKDGYIRSIQIQPSGETAAQSFQTISAGMFIDCSYEGDLMAKAGVSYTVGREANSVYRETYNGVQVMDGHQFPEGVDPYKIPGNPQSGLLWGISEAKLEEAGSGDKKVQAYNFRICLTDNAANSIPVSRPFGYDSTKYELLLRVIEKEKDIALRDFLKMDMMPGRKTDINNNGPFSTDMIGMNYDYPEADYATRRKIFNEHEKYVKGLLYFIGHDIRMPERLRTAMLRWGYPKDEYTENDHWTPQMYVREARRMKGAYIMTQANCEGREKVEDGVGMAAYTMDSHNCQRIALNGMVKNEGDVEIGGFGPYPIAYRAIIPKGEECKNLLVPVCLSASHIAYGSIRMEPVFMELAQSAATAAVLALRLGITVQDVDVKNIWQTRAADPLADGSVPEILIDNEDTAHVTLTGDWQKMEKEAYGPSLFLHETGAEASVKFLPEIKKAGSYHIYTYLPLMKGMSSKTLIMVFDGVKKRQIPLPALVKAEGQTSGEWVDLGAFTLPAGKKAYVSITSQQADGAVIADAILFKPA